MTRARAALPANACRACGRRYALAPGRCPGCGGVGTFVFAPVDASTSDNTQAFRLPGRRRLPPPTFGYGRFPPFGPGGPGAFHPFGQGPYVGVGLGFPPSFPQPYPPPPPRPPPPREPDPDPATHLRLADDLFLPALAACTQTFAILAKRGMGKSYLGTVLAEELVRTGQQIIVLDPVGSLWGLTRDADGAPGGLALDHRGGDHSDVPLPPDAGKALAHALAPSGCPKGCREPHTHRVAARGPSALLDLSHLRRADQTRFVADFLEELYFLQGTRRVPLHLMLDECDLFAPQAGADDGQKRTLAALEDCVRRGRARGFGISLISQRPSVIHKNVLTQTECLFVLRLTAPQDKEAIKAWVHLHGDDDMWYDMSDNLPTLAPGEGYVWCPGWLGLFQRVKVARKRTLDSSATPGAVPAVATSRWTTPTTPTTATSTTPTA